MRRSRHFKATMGLWLAVAVGIAPGGSTRASSGTRGDGDGDWSGREKATVPAFPGAEGAGR